MLKPLLALMLLCLPAFALDPVGDFSTPDVNSGSDRRKVTSTNVSPRNYLNSASAWYFGDEG